MDGAIGGLNPASTATPEEDLIRVEQAYERMNQLWKLHGPAAVGSVYQFPQPRAAVMGMDHGEVDRVISGIETFFAWGTNHDWIQQWTEAGHAYAERARDAQTAGRLATAGKTWRLASTCYFFGWYIHNHFVPIPARDAAQQLCIDAYRSAAPLLVPPCERVDVPFKERSLPGYLRLPQGSTETGRWPLAIVIGGANSTKEENHPLTSEFLQRGIATFAYDGPGQNEFLLSGGSPLRVDLYDESLRTVVDWLQRDHRIDSDRLALFGRSGGGIVALHAAAAEPRLKGVVAHPGSFAWSPYTCVAPDVLTVPMELARWLGASSFRDLRGLMERELTLEPVIADLHVPTLLINSRQDGMFPWSEAELVKERAPAPVETAYFDTKAHGGPPTLSWPLAADWVAQQLAK